MPGIDGLDTLKEIKKEHPSLPVLIFTMYPEEQYAVRLIKSGASGYLNKESSPEELINAIRKIHSGRKYISPGIGELLADNTDIEPNFKLHEKLSDREYQVMCLIACGLTVNQIAEKLSLSVSTIGTYRMRILEKMNMNTNAEITYYAVKNGLVK
jgi:DNA-binding NarL/FixJ family response regulator